jgi:hypothetical protein
MYLDRDIKLCSVAYHEGDVGNPSPSSEKCAQASCVDLDAQERDRKGVNDSPAMRQHGRRVHGIRTAILEA